MKNIISKTAFKTILVVLIAAVLAFGVASLGFPQHMATFFENTGNYRFATGYASLAYTYSGTFDNLARCVDDSILSGSDSNIVNFASRMVQDDRFDEYCEERDKIIAETLSKNNVTASTNYSYKQYIMGNLACSMYVLDDADGALEIAKTAVKGVGFPSNNALVMLAQRAVTNSDEDMKNKLREIIKEIQVAPDETEYRDSVIEFLR